MKMIFFISCLLIITSYNVEQKAEKMEVKKIIGISVVTTNENGQSNKDIGALWGKFFEMSSQIPNKISDDIYSIYTDYETDYTGKYTAIIGFEVSTLNEIPNGFIGREIGGGKYKKFLAKGEMPRAVVETWKKIWEKDAELNRRYTNDFEVHGVNSQNGSDSEVEIFIAVK